MMRWGYISVLAGFSIVLVGCAGSGESQRWQSVAQSVAESRLHGAPAAVSDRPTNVAVGLRADRPLADRQDAGPTRKTPGAFGLSPAEARIGVVEELETARLVVDGPTSQPAAVESGEAVVEVERGPLPTFGETVKRDIREAPGLLWRDTKAVYCNPWNVVFLVGVGGVSVALRPEVDDDIEDHYHPDHRYRHTMSKGWRNFFDAAGNPGTHFALAGAWYLGGQLLQDAKTYEVGKRMASALIITDLSTLFLKLAAADTKSPNGDFYAWPSGHMSSSVAFATVLADAYGPLAGIPAYTFCVFEGIQRIDSREHKFSDVVFGAALGYVVAHTIMKEHRPEICGGEIVPWVSAESGSSGIGWLKTFDEPTKKTKP